MGASAQNTVDTGFMQQFGAFPASRIQAVAQWLGQRLSDNWGSRRFSGWMRFVLQSTATSPVDVIKLGSKMRLHLGDNACERRLMVTPQFFEPGDLAILERYIRPGFHFVDVGANIGTYSLFVAKRAGADAKIIAIEPQPKILKRLEENIAFNEVDVKVFPVAVLGSAGDIELTVDENNYGFTSVHSGRKGRGAQSTVTVQARPLIDIVTEAGMERIDAMKIDVEGAEDLALLPFMDNSPERLWPKLILVEHNNQHWKRNVIEELASRGYREIPGATNNVALVRE